MRPSGSASTTRACGASSNITSGGRWRSWICRWCGHRGACTQPPAAGSPSQARGVPQHDLREGRSRTHSRTSSSKWSRPSMAVNCCSSASSRTCLRRQAVGVPRHFGISGPVVVDISLLFDLAHDGATASFALDQPREGEIAPARSRLAADPPIQNVLNLLPKVGGNDRLLASLICLAVPIESARIDPVVQYLCNCAPGNTAATLTENKTNGPRPLCRFANLPACVPLEQVSNDWRNARVENNGLSSVRASHIPISERSV